MRALGIGNSGSSTQMATLCNGRSEWRSQGLGLGAECLWNIIVYKAWLVLQNVTRLSRTSTRHLSVGAAWLLPAVNYYCLIVNLRRML